MVIRKEGWQVEIVREFEIDMYTLIYLKMITNKDLLYSIGILFNILQQPIWVLEKEMATHSSILAWAMTWDRGAWQATVHGVAKVRHD